VTSPSVLADRENAPSDPRGPLARLFRVFRSSAAGLSSLEAERRLVVYGPNQLSRRGGRRWPGELARQFTHPLALLLAAAALLALISGTAILAAAIVGVIALNAVFAFLQEMHAEHAIEALAAYLPTHASVLRDGSRQQVEAGCLVPGDVLVIEEGDRISADARLITGTVEIDLSTLTGESQPVTRVAGDTDPTVALLQAEDMVSAAAPASGVKPTPWSPRPACVPRSAGSLPSPNGSAGATAHSRPRSRRSPS